MLDIHHLPGSNLQEKNVLIFRRHPITLLPLLFITVLLMAIPPAAYVFLKTFQPDFFGNDGYKTIFIVLAAIFFLSGWLFLFQSFIDYWLDALIITEKRILDIDQKGLFNRTVSELRLYRTQDVTADVKGLIRTLFDYGDVYVQTAGEAERFHMEDMPHPNRVAKMILEWAEQDRKEHLEDAVEDFGMPDQKTGK